MVTIWHSSSEEPLLAIVDEQGETEYSVPLLIRKPLHTDPFDPTQYTYLGRYEYHFGAQVFLEENKPHFYLMESNVEWCYLESKYESEHRCILRQRLADAEALKNGR